MIPAFVRDLGTRGDAPALVFPSGRVIGYADLARRVERQAALLGVGKRLVAVEARLSEHAIVAYLAALKAGHAVALLPPDDPDTAAGFEAAFLPEFRCRMVGGRWRTEEGAGAGEAIHADLALLLSTSGSTGVSRSVRLSAGNLDANAAAIAKFLGLRPSDRGTLALPLHYCYGLSVLNSHLAAGASVFVPDKAILDPGFVDDLRRYGCTNFAGVPYSYELLERIGFRNAGLPDLRFMTVAGGRLSPHLVARYHAHLAGDGRQFFVMYGQTEATARIAFVPPDRLGANPDRIGVAIPGGALRLLDEEGREVEAAETPGELVYRGPNVMMGYASTRADLAAGAELDELRTGDLALRDRDGLYRIVGRLRRMSKIAGVRVGHDALEQALAARGIPAAVVGDDRSILAVYSSPQPEQEVRRALVEASGLPAFHLEARAVDRLPRLPSGKIDYERLRSGMNEGEGRPAAESVSDVFRHAFFPRRIRETDSFAGLGGDSLRHVEISMGLERLLGHLPEGWERVPIARLASLRRQDAGSCAIGTDLVVRALAVLLVVVQHATLWPVPGGAAAMVMLAGYSLARFQSDALFAGDAGRVLRPLAMVLAPYYLILAGYAIAWGQIPWASVFLVGNFGIADPAERTMLPFLYWFVEAFAQMILVWTGLFLLAPVRRFARRRPFAFGLAFIAGAVGLRFVGPELWQIGGRQIFTLPWILYLSVFGWCVFFADSGGRKLALLAAGAVVFPLMAWFGGNWTGAWVKYLLQLAFLGALLYVPRIRLPGGVVRLILPVSAAGYHIYLFHRFVPELLLRPLEAELPQPVFTVAAILGGIAAGVLAHAAQKAALRRLQAMELRGRATVPRRHPEVIPVDRLPAE